MSASRLSAQAAQAQPAEEDDPWATGTGMAADFVGYISEPYFGVDEKYNENAMLFQAVLIDPEGEPVTTIKMSVGQEWEADQSGESVSHPTKTKINNSSRFGRFIDRIAQPTTERAPKSSDVVSPKGKENGLGLGQTLRSRGTPLEAKSFEGLGFFWQLHKMPTMGKDAEGNVQYRDVLLPTEYVGTWDERASQNGQAKGAAVPARAQSPARPSSGRPAGANPRGAAAPAAAATVEAPAAEGADSPDIPGPLRIRLTRLAQSSDAKTFIRQIAKDKEVQDLPDETMTYLLGSGPGGFWAEVQS